MKEPLKNKKLSIWVETCSVDNSEGKNIMVSEEGFTERDIKLAVEWLKDRIYKIIAFEHTKEWEKQNKLIDKAFEDIFKK